MPSLNNTFIKIIRNYKMRICYNGNIWYVGKLHNQHREKINSKKVQKKLSLVLIRISILYSNYLMYFQTWHLE